MKLKLSKLIPLIGIGIIGIAGIATGTALALTAKSNNNVNDIVFNKSSSLSYFAFQNLISYDVLNDPKMLSNYLFDYGVFGNVSSNPYSEARVNIIENLATSNFYTVTNIELVSKDGKQSYKYDCNIQTGVKVVTEIDTIDFSRLTDLFLKFNTYSEAYQQCFSSSNLVNFVTSNTNLSSTFIDNVSINLSNDYNNTKANTLAFNLTITLNDEYVYNGSNVIFMKLETSISIDWKKAFDNANSYFNINSQGVITGITDEGLKQEFLVIPSEYSDANFNTNNITGIESLLPSDNNTLDASNIKAIILPNNIKYIGNNAFGNKTSTDNMYKNLVWINLPKSLQSIGNQAFANCTKLQNLDFASLNFLLSIGENAFYNCDTFTYIILNDNVNKLGVSVFDNLDNLKRLKLSRSLTEIPNIAFGSSKRLKSINIPYGVTKIGEQAFAYSGATTINFPYSIQNIGTSALANLNCKNFIFLDRGVDNPIKFDSTVLGGQSRNFNWNSSIYILGNYTNGNYTYWSFPKYNNVYIYFDSQRTYSTIVSSSGNNLNNNSYYYIMDKNNYPLPEISNLDKFIAFVQETVKTGEDILNIASNSNYVRNLVQNFQMLFNPGWVQTFEFYPNTINNYVSELKFKVILTNHLSFDIIVPLSSPIYYPQGYLFNEKQQLIISDSVQEELKNIIDNYFKANANTYSNDLNTILGGVEKVEELYNLMNVVLEKYTNGYIDANIFKYNVWGGNSAWSSSNGYRTIDIAFGVSTPNSNSIYVGDNDFGIQSTSYNGTQYILFNDIETNIRA